MANWRLWKTGELIASDTFSEAHLDSWEKTTHPWTLSLQAYLDEREKALGQLPDEQLSLHLDVDVHDAKRLLTQPDLDNYLIPLVKRLGFRKFVHATGAKRIGGGSRLSVSRAVLGGDTPEGHGWHYVEYHTPSIGDGKKWRQEFHTALLAQYAEPAPPGPIEAHVAWRCCRSRRTWMNLWKPTIDTLGPILGEHPTANHQFNPEDGRITRLQLHVNNDKAMGNTVEIGVWWRPTQ